MAHYDKVEQMARQVVAILLRNPRWDARLDALCQSLHDDAAKATPKRTMMAVAARAETMLRHIAQGDYVAIGRLYFDILPAAGHPLTDAVIKALSQPDAALRMMREAGLHPQVRKDDTGTNFLEIDVPDFGHDMCAATRQAVTAAMTTVGEEPTGALRTVH